MANLAILNLNLESNCPRSEYNTLETRECSSANEFISCPNNSFDLHCFSNLSNRNPPVQAFQTCLWSVGGQKKRQSDQAVMLNGCRGEHVS